MNIIIDTHIFLWAVSEPERLGASRRVELETQANRVDVSAVSVVEIMIKASLGKLAVNFNPVEIAQASGFELLEFSALDALPLKDLPFHHRDPFDRMLIAQGITRGYSLMTDDQKFSPYDCTLVQLSTLLTFGVRGSFAAFDCSEYYSPSGDLLVSLNALGG